MLHPLYVCDMQGKTEEQRKDQVARLKKSDEDKRKKLKSLGIDYEFSGYVSSMNLPP